VVPEFGVETGNMACGYVVSSFQPDINPAATSRVEIWLVSVGPIMKVWQQPIQAGNEVIWRGLFVFSLPNP